MTRLLLLAFALLLAAPARAQTVVPTTLDPFVFALVDLPSFNRVVESVERRASIAEATYYVLTRSLPARDTTYDSPAYLKGYADGLREGLRSLQLTVYLPISAPPGVVTEAALQWRDMTYASQPFGLSIP